jgi:arginyl-tRNA synthetase
LKFFLLRVDPHKRMLFNPEESIDLHGFTATFIQYVHARIQSVLRKEGWDTAESKAGNFRHAAEALIQATPLLPLEKSLLVLLEQYPGIIESAGFAHDPSLVANYAFRLGQVFNSFYAEHSIAREGDPAKKALRLAISRLTGHVLSSAMGLLGIRVPDRM